MQNCFAQRCIASLPSSLRQMSRVLAVPAHRRPLNSAQTAPMESEDVPELPKRSRVAAAREQLKQDSRTLNDFLGLPSEEATATGSCSSSAPSPEAVSRDEEMHRSVLGQLKPDYVKADGSFKRLRCGPLYWR